MQVQLWLIGKTSEQYLQEGIELYSRRVEHYLSFSTQVFQLKKKKNWDSGRIMKEEAGLIIGKLERGDHLILLDEAGKSFTSVQFATFIQSKLQFSANRIIFLIGGAYGIDQALYDRANARLSLSKMTFSHQMIRLFFIEQLYRALTILNNEPYHH